MTRLCRCDSCDKIMQEDEWTPIKYPNGKRMYRCPDCIDTRGYEPERRDYITFKKFKAIMGLEDRKYIVSYHPKKFPCDVLEIIYEKNKFYW